MGKAYIISSFRVPKSVLVAFELLVGHHNQETKQFYGHVYHTQRLYLKRDGYDENEDFVPVSTDLMRRTWGEDKVHWKVLEQEGLLEVKRHPKITRLSFEYRLPTEKFQHLNKAWPAALEDYANVDHYNLITGKRMQPQGSSMTQEDGSKLPPLIQMAIEHIKPCTVNDDAMEALLQERWPGGLDKIDSPKEKASFLVDSFSRDAMRMNIVSLCPENKGFFQYQPTFTVQSTGRLTENDRGAQSCSRQMKQAAFTGIKNLHNYDLESSQIWILVQYFETAGISADWLITYLHTGKEPYYTSVGLDKSTWKACLIALILGSTCPRSLDIDEENTEHDSSIVNYILKYHQGNTALAKDSIEKFFKLTAPLAKSKSLWYKWLIEYFINLTGVAYFYKGKHYVKNSTGMKFCVSDYKKNGKFIRLDELRRKLGAFFLQGSEACFIHNLTLLQDKYDFKVVNNQHDGLVTEGVIPQEAVDEAKQLAGLKYATLVEKPFA